MRGPLGLRDLILAWYGGTVFVVLVLVLLTVHAEVSRETDRFVARQMDATRQAIESLTEERTATLGLLARLAGQEPRLGAVMGTDPVTISDVLTRDLNPGLEADFIRVTDQRGRVRADTAGRALPGTDLSRDDAVRAALAGNGWRGTLVFPGEIDLVAAAPLRVGGQDLGTITLGRRVSDEMVAQLCWRTGSRVTLFAGGRIAASNWPPALRPALLCALREALPAAGPPGDRTLRFTMPFAGHQRMCLLTSLPGQGGARGALLIQTNLDSALRPYVNMRRTLVFIAFMGLLIAALGSVIIADRVTQPLERIARAARR